MSDNFPQRKDNYKKQDGFTLIEVLVSVLLLSFVVAISSLALRNLLLSWKKVSIPYPKNGVAFYRFQTSFNSLLPYVTKNTDRRSKKIEYNYFFNGYHDQCEFISRSPLQSKSSSLIKISLSDGKIEFSEVNLFTCDSNYLFPESQKYTTTTVLIENVSDLNFFYKVKDEWYQEITGALPDTVKMSFTNNAGVKNDFFFNIRSYNYREKLVMVQRM